MEESDPIKHLEIQALKTSEIFKKLLITGDDSYYFAEMETGLIIDLNDNFIDLFGYARVEAIGKTSLELRLYKNPGDRALLVSELKSMGFVKNMELQARRKNGNIFTCALSVNIVQLEKPYLVGVIRDITKRKKADEMLASKNRMLTSINKYTQAIAFTPPEELFTTVATMLKDISGASEVFINVYDEEKAELVLRKSTLSEENNTWIRKNFGNKLVDVRTPVPRDKYDEIMNSPLGRVGSINEATFGAIPKSVGRIIENHHDCRKERHSGTGERGTSRVCRRDSKRACAETCGSRDASEREPVPLDL
jgi:PAS domain S-box-containing protein